jgi:2-dehydropantoate 2-reductase
VTSAADVAVVGPGAIGSLAALAAQMEGHRVRIFGRSDPGVPIRVVQQSGTPIGELDFPVIVLGDRNVTTGDAGGSADWVLVAVKAHQTHAAGPVLAALCKPSTTVVALQNGVEQVEGLRPYVNGAEVLPTVVWINAERIGPAEVAVDGSSVPRLHVPVGSRGEAFATLLADSATLRVELVEDFRSEAWRKLAVNAINGLMALTSQRARIYQRSDIAALTRALAVETLAVARAEGADLPESEADVLVEMFTAMPPDRGTSILADRLAGRALEWDVRNGVVRRLGRRHGLATPVSDVLVPLLAAVSEA